MSERKRSGDEGPMGKWGRSPYDVEAFMQLARMAKKEESSPKAHTRAPRFSGYRRRARVAGRIIFKGRVVRAR